LLTRTKTIFAALNVVAETRSLVLYALKRGGFRERKVTFFFRLSMCGIFFSARWVDVDDEKPSNYQKLTLRLQRANGARGWKFPTSFINRSLDLVATGPDAQRTCQTFLQSKCAREDISKQGLLLNFFASELRLRGDAPVVQPHEHAGNIFCWNGEVGHCHQFPAIFLLV
jgi:hypothetical protein